MAKPMVIVGNGGNLPSSSKFRYHQAARDGYLDLLKGSVRMCLFLPVVDLTQDVDTLQLTVCFPPHVLKTHVPDRF